MRHTSYERLTSLVLGSTAALGMAPISEAQCDLRRLAPTTLLQPSTYGFDFALFDDLAFVTANGESVQGVDVAGAVYVFERDLHGLGPAVRLTPFDPATGQRFGAAVATDGQRIAVATEASNTVFGGVYIFVRTSSGWAFEQVLRPPLNTSFGFGLGLSIAGDWLALRSNSGELELYERAGGTWTLQSSRRRPDGGFYGLGTRVRLDGERLFVHRDRLQSGRNFVEILRREPTGWVSEDLIVESSTSAIGGFGEGLDVAGDRLVVGDPDDERVRVYGRSGALWSLTGEFGTPDGGRFGWRVGLDSARIVVSEPNDPGPFGFGALVVHEEGPMGWVETARHARPADWPVELDWRVNTALDGADFIVEGTVPIPGQPSPVRIPHLVSLNPRPDVRFCAATPSSAGLPGRIDVVGARSVAAGGVLLVASHVPAVSLVLFVYGPGEGALGLGNGLLCVDPFGGGLVRLSPAVASDAAGEARLTFDSSTASPLLPFAAGASYVFQAWYRDPVAGGARFNLTDALRVTFCP